jgi:hypothetical protein
MRLIDKIMDRIFREIFSEEEYLYKFKSPYKTLIFPAKHGVLLVFDKIYTQLKYNEWIDNAIN